MKKEREQHQQDGGTASAAAAFGSDPEGGAAAEAGGAGAVGGGEGGAADAAALAGKHDDGRAQFVTYIYEINGMSPRMFNHRTRYTHTHIHTLHSHTPVHPHKHLQLYENVLPVSLCCSAPERSPLDTLYHSIRPLSLCLSLAVFLCLSLYHIYLLYLCTFVLILYSMLSLNTSIQSVPDLCLVYV